MDFEKIDDVEPIEEKIEPNITDPTGLLDNRVMDIAIGMNGTISTAPYENWKPGFYMKVNTEGLTQVQLREIFKEGKEELKRQFNLERNNCKADLIAEKYNNIGFGERNGIKYVWITSVLDYDKIWRMPEFELTQYGSRGHIGHEIAHDYIKKYDEIRIYNEGLKGNKKIPIDSIEWLNPEKERRLARDVATLLNGSLGMHWNDLSVKEFLKVYADKVTHPEIEVHVWNDEHLYMGRMDMFCLWDGIPTIVDYKCGQASDFRQLAAGAVCREGIKQMVIASIGPTSNKSGYMQPKISDDISGEFRLFLKKRHEFRKAFGI
jgi:hypothetical protein